MDLNDKIIGSGNHRLLKIQARWWAKYPIHEIASVDRRPSTRFVPCASLVRAGLSLGDIL